MPLSKLSFVNAVLNNINNYRLPEYQVFLRMSEVHYFLQDIVVYTQSKHQRCNIFYSGTQYELVT